MKDSENTSSCSGPNGDGAGEHENKDDEQDEVHVRPPWLKCDDLNW